jgi:hypothetical protein
VNQRCIICEHPRAAHFGAGCHIDSFLRGRCDCDFVELPALPLTATPAQHRARAAWWQQRVEMAEARMRRTRMGTERWWRLDRFADVARTARARGLDMAAALDAEATAATAADPGDDLLDLVNLETVATQEPATLRHVLEHLESSGGAEQAALRSRLTAEFDALEPRHRRELLEDDAFRGFLDHIGVVSAWDASVPSDAPSDACGDASALTSSTIGPEITRAQIEAYWRHWAQAPSPRLLIAYIAMDPDEFKVYLALAAEVLTPAERSRFANRTQLNGWIVSGMRPLFEDGREVLLEDVIDQGYLPVVAF